MKYEKILLNTHSKISSSVMQFKKINKINLGVIIFALYPYFFSIFISFKIFHNSIPSVIMILFGIIILLLKRKQKILVLIKDLYWALPFLVILVGTRSGNKTSLIFLFYFTVGIVFIILTRTEFYSFKYGIIIIYLISFLVAISIFISKYYPNFFEKYLYIYYSLNAKNIAKAGEGNGYYTGMIFSVALSAGYIVNAIGISFSLNMNSNIKKILFMIFLFAALILTSKRAHLLITILCIFLFYYIKSTNSKKWISSLILLMFLSIFIVNIEAINSLFEEKNAISRLVNTVYETIKGENIDKLSSGRLTLYSYALYLFFKNPVLGAGWGEYVEGSQYYMGNIVATHNIYLQLLCETGLLGILLFLIPMLLEYKKIILLLKKNQLKKYSAYIKISFFFQTFFLLYGFSGNPLYDNSYLFIYFFSLAISEAVQYQIKKYH